MTNLEKLEKEIRLKLPRLMELKEDCIIDTPYGITKVHHISIDEDFKDVLFICKQLQYRACPVKHITIIGHEIKLNDVLEWCKNKGLSIEDYEDGNLLSITWFEHKNNRLLSKSVNWDLSKNLLKDQSQELIDVLFRLIPN